MTCEATGIPRPELEQRGAALEAPWQGPLKLSTDLTQPPFLSPGTERKWRRLTKRSCAEVLGKVTVSESRKSVYFPEHTILKESYCDGLKCI